MENSKLNQLLAKLEVLPIENESTEFIELDERCEHLKGSIGAYNTSCSNSSCGAADGNNGACTNTGCSGAGVTNSKCKNIHL